MSDTRKSILKATDLSIVFGGLKAVSDFNIDIKEGDLYGLIGPNGAGKTTVFNLVTGIYKPTTGEVQLDGEVLNPYSPHVRVEKGIARTFQNIRLFKKLTVLENVKIAFHKNMSYNVFQAIFRTKKYWKEENLIHEKALEILEDLGLLEYKDEVSESLPYGKQRKLEIARALATNPKLLLLDEPAAGMNPHETEELMETIEFIKVKFNTTILLIEHDMKLVMGICDKISVLNFGQVIAEGTPAEIQANEEVIKAYLGE